MVKDADSLLAIREDRNRFVAFAFAATDLVAETDDSGKILFAAGAVGSIFARKDDSLVGANLFELTAEQDREKVRKMITQLKEGRRLGPLLIRARDEAGEDREIQLRGYCLPESSDRIFLTMNRGWPHVGATAFSGGSRDSATGLLDKQSFSDSVGQQMAAARAVGDDLSVTMVDMSALGSVRSHLDDEAEHELLTNVSKILRANSVDGSSASRIADDRFALLHTAGLDLPDVTGVIESFVRSTSPWAQDFEVDTATVDLDGVTMSEQEASRAVLYVLNEYSESETGEFRLTQLSEGYREMLAETLSWQTRIKRTIRDGEFSLAFQPIVDLADARVHHYEALARIPNQPNGSPVRFITMAEQLGNIAEFDLSVATRVIGLLQGVDVSDVVPIAINVSGRSLATPDFTGSLVKLIEQNRGICQFLLIEVTESSKIVDLQAANEALQAIRNLDVRVCLDDFGVGAATFEYLRSLRVDFVKIDGSFVKDLERSKFGRAFVRSIAALCEELGVKTIAEMVEDEKIVHRLRAAGVPLGQGWHFGQPNDALPWSEEHSERSPRSARPGSPQWDPLQGRRVSA